MKLFTYGVVAEIGLREIGKDLLYGGIDAIRRDHVVRERLQDPSTGIVDDGRPWVIDGILDDRTSGEVGSQVAITRHRQVVAQVTCHVGAVRHSRGAGVQALAVAIPLHVEEKKRLVFPL